MNPTRTKATAADVDSCKLFHPIEGDICTPIAPIQEIGTGDSVLNNPVKLDELEIVDLAVIDGESRHGRFLQVADYLNTVPKTIFVFQGNSVMAANRKIIQIQALRFNGAPCEDGQPSQETELIALCDDGSVWTRTSTLDGEWVCVEDIPQY